jgi:uncharacterized repeat protein (TIGR01451 family)
MIANAATAQEADVQITISDELVLQPGDPRVDTPQRDDAGNLITRPGDIIRYELTAINRGNAAAYEVEIVDPIPQGTEYIEGSAAGEGMVITYSIDDGRYYQPAPIMEDFRKPDGTTERRAVPVSRYTHVKWRVENPILPGLSADATMSVRVSPANTSEGSDE